MKTIDYWTIGPYTVTQHEDGKGRELYSFDLGNGKNAWEYYESLDMCLIAMVGEKYTGRRGAGGEGVGTAADWFARMIGMTKP